MTQKARFILCAVVPLYLAGDFFLFNGPLNRAIQVFNPESPQSIAKAVKKGIVARIGHQSVSASQLDRAVFERLWFEGKTLAGLKPDEQKLARKAALGDLVEQQLLRSQIESAEPKIEVSATEIDAYLKSVTERFESKDVMDAALKAQGIVSENTLRDRIADHLRAEKFIAAKIAPNIAVTDADGKKWFDEHAKDLALPERVEARHIFIATLNLPSEEAKKKIDEALAQLNAKQKDFPTLAKELSEDPTSKDAGGNLGWLTRARLSPDFAEPIFSIPEKQPTLVRTRLGWHIVEVLTRKPSGPRSFDDAKAEVLSALEAAKRRDAVKAFREELRKSSVEVRILDPELAG